MYKHVITMNTIEQLSKAFDWRYATKKFDATKKISAETLTLLKDAMRKAPSSFGLQPYEVYLVESDEVKEKLSPACMNQPQITTASHLAIFVAKNEVSEDYVEKFTTLVRDERNFTEESWKNFDAFLKGVIASKGETVAGWTQRQAYISAGFLLLSAAGLEIDSCPMEGFNPEAVAEVLGVNFNEYTPVVMVALGHRSEEDATQHMPKVRVTEEKLIHTL
ncbi:MAG: NAD(P)H-dependent oxidoreductase [Crocinitomicaceae bacterium]|nr:NAD(P)H-dependent oxidoreductase [Crocinitomicaceae bacterium]